MYHRGGVGSKWLGAVILQQHKPPRQFGKLHCIKFEDLWALLLPVKHTKKKKGHEIIPSYVHYLNEVCILCNRHKFCGKDTPLKTPLPLHFELKHLSRHYEKPPAKPDSDDTF